MKNLSFIGSNKLLTNEEVELLLSYMSTYEPEEKREEKKPLWWLDVTDQMMEINEDGE